MLAVTLLAVLGHSQVCNRQPSHLWMIPVTRQKFSRKITPKKVIKGVKNCTFKPALTFFPLQVWTTRLSIHLRMSPMHQSLVAESSSATSNREIISIRRKSSAIQRLSSQGLVYTKICLDGIYLQKQIKTFCIRHQLSFSSDPLGILVPALHVFWPNSPDATSWCPIFYLVHISLSSFPRQTLLVIAHSSQFSYPTCTTCNSGDLLCHGVKFTNGLQEPVDKLFLLSPFPPQHWSEIQFMGISRVW